jgi:ribonuclease-3
MNIDAKIALVEQIINYIFTNKVLCAESLQMAAPEKEMQVNGKVHLVQKNLNLAVLGDTLLSTLLSEMWYESRKAQGTCMQNPEAPEQ